MHTLIQVVDMFAATLSNLAQLTLERFESQTPQAPQAQVVSGVCVATPLLLTFTKKLQTTMLGRCMLVVYLQRKQISLCGKNNIV